MDTIVLKFGGASVATPEHFSIIADLILKIKKKYPRVVIVVSAMGNTTNELIALAKRVHPDPPRREYDMLVTVGERISISLLAMALSAKGHDAVSFTGSQSGIITTCDHSEARIVHVKPHRLLKNLDLGKVVIVAGFQGVSATGEITTLGRGGSDTTAVALGIALDANRVEFYKNVDGIHERDPKKEPNSRFFSELSYDEALNIINHEPQILHKRCVELAKKNSLPLFVRSFLRSHEDIVGTTIGQLGVERAGEPVYEADQQFP